MSSFLLFFLMGYFNISTCYFITSVFLYKAVGDIEKRAGSVKSRRHRADPLRNNFKKHIYLSLLWPIPFCILLKDIMGEKSKS
tara:strand:- start:151 stop:399 length:249 start_codon:yes stop_codon:yes gene_type:complete